MLRSYLRTALRVFWRNKGFSVLNVAGLTVGLACTFLILIWIRDELAYDRFHETSDRLYRVMRHAYYGDGQAFTWPAIPKPLEQEMRDSYPEVTSWRLSAGSRTSSSIAASCPHAKRATTPVRSSSR